LDILIVIILSYIAVVAQATYFRAKVKATPVVSPSPVKRIEDGPSSPDHVLVKTWLGRDDSTHAIPGWRWKCSCGTIGASSDASRKTNSLGSENNAIARFKDHATLYREANGNTWKDAYDRLQAKHDAFVAQCFCKDTITHKPLERL
jgi:hypothetical protein